MRIPYLYGLLAVVAGSVAADADFMSVRTQLAKDWSGKGGDPAVKYFHESTFHPHYDGRFASAPLPEEQSLSYLISLVQTYLATMNDLGVETWIMHGSLLGWWWNQKILPWDSDLDVQVSEPGMHFLGDYYNMTEHHYNIPGVPEGRTYLLEVNPNYINRSTRDRDNVIDARWIDMSSGLFIDITSVRTDDIRRQRGDLGALICKDAHRYQENDIFPLRDSLFEGIPVKIPYAYTKLLSSEYGGRSLTNVKFNGHTFVEESQEWVKDIDVIGFEKPPINAPIDKSTGNPPDNSINKPVDKTAE
ncbi:LicD family-domain-containing protein [Talaromyces proteolyticus]|uniref:LicD family-domain-containing protein n=1 Tax=Talaromyces proteolyticus TaxID=1131652 RepID=A0AAD4L025_9EURO|nr:LicD family-domain-containing protein [Talaromyces proteolyticus]KAH8700424.1 LicD family-domain-containing protein [Talaromyces proteolyticus]